MERALARTRRIGKAATPARRPVRLMIVDDSLTARTVLTRLVESEGDLKVVASESTAENAIRALQTTSVDIILLDLEMPGMGGLEALPQLIKAARRAHILVVSALTVDGAEQTLAALSLGAADTLCKPMPGGFNRDYCTMLLAKIRGLGRVVPGIGEAPARPVPTRIRPGSGMPPKAIAIGASTGGIHALSLFLAALPRKLDVPILVTQHLPASFIPVFARQLKIASGFDAVVAEDGMVLRPGQITVAPGDAHLMVKARHSQLVARLDRTPASSGCLPSVDPMFASLAEALGPHALGVVLSGMGRDGVEGATGIAAAGGTIYAQDEASCAVWGMPRAIAEAGLAAAILPPQQIAGRVLANIGAVAWK